LRDGASFKWRDSEYQYLRCGGRDTTRLVCSKLRYPAPIKGFNWQHEPIKGVPIAIVSTRGSLFPIPPRDRCAKAVPTLLVSFEANASGHVIRPESMPSAEITSYKPTSRYLYAAHVR
jgi:hypothetical protein